MSISGRQDLVEKGVKEVRKSALESSLVQSFIGGKYDESSEPKKSKGEKNK